MKLWHAGLCALSLLPATALADDIDYGSFDAFYAPHVRIDAQAPDTGTVHSSGGGFGVRVLSRITNTLMFSGEYHRENFDAGLDAAEYRVGVGLALPSTTGVFLSYERAAMDLSANGFAVHLRVAGNLAGPVSAYADAAYKTLDAAHAYYDGGEFTLGATLDLSKPWGLFAEYRALRLDTGALSGNVQEQFIRVGVRYRFDC